MAAKWRRVEGMEGLSKKGKRTHGHQCGDGRQGEGSIRGLNGNGKTN